MYHEKPWTTAESTTRLAGLVALLGFAVVSGAGRASWAQGREPLPPAEIQKPLIAYWNFDEPLGTTCRDSSGQGHDASPERHVTTELQRVEGLFGGAMSFSGHHMLRVAEKPTFGTLASLSLSAWVMPTDLTVYREIFRKEDGDHRVLFSFQHDGTILSLGLNINGYVECDARIDPSQVLDGRWHHCAATFDGRFMRVNLDGVEVGSLERPGKIVAGGTAPGCIGSSNGGECFQGLMDELRIYRDALTAEEVSLLYRNGQEALARLVQHVDAGEPKLPKALIAHWTFNETAAAGVMRDISGEPALEIAARSRVGRLRGIYGSALDLRASHSLQTKAAPQGPREALALAVWVKPSDLSGNREIFRRQEPSRLLFSFRKNGTVLAFGLDVGGYVQCDAPIEPAALLDGQWHHCAATFDGRVMRVYLDGKPVGALERPGVISPGGPEAFVGSSDGQRDHFQGAMDDLRIYADALEAHEVAMLYQHGLDVLARRANELQARLGTIYARGESFAQTLAEARRRLAESGMSWDAELAELFLKRLKVDFPEPFAQFMEWTGATPLDYLVAPGNKFHVREVGRVVELMLEYRPLTEPQKAKQTPEEAQRWAEAEAIARRFEALQQQGDAVQFSPEWLEVLFAAGQRVAFRPYVREAVAPYVKPTTPPTRDLAPEEALETLQRDWLHQTAENPTPERINAEIGWARQLAARITARSGGRVDFCAELGQLAELEKQAAGLNAPDRDLYFQVRQVKRTIAFRNPLLDFDKVVMVDMPYPRGSEWPHETRHRLGYMAVPGGRLLILEGLSPAGKLRQLMPQPPLHGSFWRPDVSWDGTKILFCFKPHNEKSFHLYEINVDGTGLVQLTDGPYDDFDPIYLPDEKHIIFSTTRAHTYVRCMPPTNAYILARCDRDGKNIYLISQNNEPDYLPSVMNDGRILYTRWEYTDKPLWRAQALWTVNPDGTLVQTFWGNQSVWPDLLKDARSIPGSRRVMFTGSAHHNWFSGSVGIIDPDKGFNFPHGLTKVTADVPWPESGNGPVDPIESADYHPSGHYPAYYSPYPLGEEDFLVSAQRGGKFLLYLMDVHGNRELIYEGVHNIFHAQPLRPRPKPPVIPDRVVWPTRQQRLDPPGGVLYSGNVYQNAPAELHGRARFLRVLAIDPKTYTYWYQRPYISTGPVVSAVQSEGVKRVLGTVPIEADGSVAFQAPAGKALHFQLLDENHRALQTMRSFVGVMPGERRGCLGCHESHSRTPHTLTSCLALTRTPHEINPPPWPDTTVSYARYVQPVLDKYCAKCHQGDGQAVKTLDLTFRPGPHVFSEPYLTLIGRPSWGRPYEKPDNPPPGFGIAGMLMVEAYSTVDPAAYVTPKPMTHLSLNSRLIELCSSGNHYDVKVDEESLHRLILWVDTMCPYLGDEEVRAIDDPVFQGVDWLAIRPRIKNAPRIVRPGPID